MDGAVAIAMEDDGWDCRPAWDTVATATTAARMTGVDRYGFEMSANTAAGPRPIRLAFAKPVTTPEEARSALVAMVKEARSKLS